MGEFELIEKIRFILEQGAPQKTIRVGIGDDCAVTSPIKHSVVSTVDCLVEGVHFDLKYSKPDALGARALAVSLSDIAAMGGRPLHALVSLGLRPGISEKFILELYRGMRGLALKFGVSVVGGNLTRTHREFFIDVVVWGEAKSPKLRSAAQLGDCLVLTGPTGLSACGLSALRKFGNRATLKFPTVVAKHLKPQPRLEAGNLFARNPAVHALIDISDGLSSELHHLSKNSKVGIEIDASCLPIEPELLKVAERLKVDPLEWVLNGGEDYELLATVNPKSLKTLVAAFNRKKLSLYPVGRVVERGRGISLLTQRAGQEVKRTRLPSKGWTHLSRN